MILFYLDDLEYYELNNFYPHTLRTKRKIPKIKIQFQNKIWNTSEAIYQALKYKHETKEEQEWREIIREAHTPTIAKYLGKQYTHTKYKWQRKYRDLVLKYRQKVRYAGDFNDRIFKLNIMDIALRAKFQIPFLKQLLIDTYPMKLGEKTESFWGYMGENAMGYLLECLRREFLDAVNK